MAILLIIMRILWQAKVVPFWNIMIYSYNSYTIKDILVCMQWKARMTLLIHRILSVHPLITRPLYTAPLKIMSVLTYCRIKNICQKGWSLGAVNWRGDIGMLDHWELCILEHKGLMSKNKTLWSSISLKKNVIILSYIGMWLCILVHKFNLAVICKSYSIADWFRTFLDIIPKTAKKKHFEIARWRLLFQTWLDHWLPGQEVQTGTGNDDDEIGELITFV